MNTKSNKLIFLLFLSLAIATGVAFNNYDSAGKTTTLNENAARWYVYGLPDFSKFAKLQEKLKPHNVVLVFRGCDTGGGTDEKDRDSNQQTFESASPELKSLLNKHQLYRSPIY